MSGGTTSAEVYLARLREELTAAGASDVDDLVAEVRSLIADAATEESGGVPAVLARMGEASELAHAILADRGAEPLVGLPSKVWWRLAAAAPLDIAIGVSVPLAAVVPLVNLARTSGQPAAVALAVVLGAVSLAWPWYVWRPWRRGGRSLTPGMALAGIAVVRAGDTWRLVPLEELAALGLAMRRRSIVALAVVVAALALIGLAWVFLAGR